MLCQWQGRQALRRLSGPPPRPQRLRFRRPAAAHAGDPEDPPRRAGALSAALQIYPRRRISGHQPEPVSLAPPARAGAQEPLLRRRRRPEHLFMARRRSLQYPAVRKGFSRREDHPPRAELPLHPEHPRRRLRPDRAEQRPARQGTVDRAGRGRQGPGDRRLGRARGGAPRRRRTGSDQAARRPWPARPARPRGPAAARLSLGNLVGDFARWRSLLSSSPERGGEPSLRDGGGGPETKPLSHPDLARLVLDESGYTAMLQIDRSAESAGRLENLAELA